MQVAASKDVEVRASPERLYGLLTDFERYPEWYPGVVEATVLERDRDGPSVVRLVFDPGVPLLGIIDAELALKRTAPRLLQPTAVGGRLKNLRGEGWRLEELETARTRVNYELAAELDTGLPGILERRFVGPAKHFLVEEPVRLLKERGESA